LRGKFVPRLNLANLHWKTLSSILTTFPEAMLLGKGCAMNRCTKGNEVPLGIINFVVRPANAGKFSPTPVGSKNRTGRTELGDRNCSIYAFNNQTGEIKDWVVE